MSLWKFLAGAALIAVSIAVPGLGTFAASAIFSAGLSLASSAVFSALRERQQGALANVMDPQAALPIVYGATRLGLRITDMRLKGATGDDADELYIVGALCHGSSDGSGIEAIDEIYFNGELAVAADGTVQAPYVGKLEIAKHLGTDAQTVDTLLNAAFPTRYTIASPGCGVAYLVLHLTFDQDVYPAGRPEVTVNVRGCKVFDPRDDSTAYSTNPILCLRDYLSSSRYGFGAADTELSDSDFEAMADYCDALVNVPDGSSGTTTQKRFEANGWLSPDVALAENVHLLLTACRGNLAYEGGKFRPWIRRVVTPTTFEITEDMIVGDIEYTIPGQEDKPNKAKYTFVGERTNYQADTRYWPRPGDSNSYLSADNGYPVEAELQLPMTDDIYRAEQIAETTLKERRQALGVRFLALEEALQLTVGDVVPITHSSPSWTSKGFWVQGVRFDPASHLVEITATEYDADAYTADSAADQAEPDTPGWPVVPTVIAPPTDVAVAVTDEYGRWLKALQLTWTASVGPYLLYYEIQVKPSASGESAWESRQNALRDETVANLSGISPSTDWDVRIRAGNWWGATSEWVTVSNTATGDLEGDTVVDEIDTDLAAVEGATILTAADETATLASSRQLADGINTSVDVATASKIKVNVSGLLPSARFAGTAAEHTVLTIIGGVPTWSPVSSGTLIGFGTDFGDGFGVD